MTFRAGAASGAGTTGWSGRSLVRLPGLALAAALVLGAASAARADSIGGLGSSCATCLGSLYTLTYTGTPESTTPTTETWRITLAIDTTDYFGLDGMGGGTPVNRFIQGVSIAVSDSVLSGALVSAPGGAGLWNPSLGLLVNPGCKGSGNEGFCADVTSPNLTTAPVGGVYEWVFDVEIPMGGLHTGPGAAAIRANYINTLGAFRGQTDEAITLQLVPEPSTLGLLALGAGVLAVGRRRSPAS